jgi:hypothetical protein
MPLFPVKGSCLGAAAHLEAQPGQQVNVLAVAVRAAEKEEELMESKVLVYRMRKAHACACHPRHLAMQAC